VELLIENVLLLVLFKAFPPPIGPPVKKEFIALLPFELE
jgi:hypothetical protein